MGQRTPEQVVRHDWVSSENVTWEQIIALSNLHAARQMERVVAKLDAVIMRLDMLGREGIHEVVKEMARDARAKKKRRLAARRRRRALKVAA